MERIAKYNAQSSLLRKAGITENDVLKIWDALALYLRDEMSKKKGIVMPGFGTFSYIETRLEIGNNKIILKVKPFFTLSEKFAKHHSIEYPKDNINHAIPVTKLNYATISEKTKRKYSREIVKLVLCEAFNTIDHFLRSEGVITIPFKGFGVLRILDVNPKPKRQASFEFSPDIANYLPIC